MSNKLNIFFISIFIISLTSLPISALAKDYSTSADEAAKSELTNNFPWVRDVYVSPGHMNVGVLKNEKKWDSPMIGLSVCGVLAKHGSSLTMVRFVDIEAVAYKGKSPTQAEIAIFKCQTK